MAKKRTVKPTQVLKDLEILSRLFTFGYFGDLPWSKVKGIRGAKLDKAIREYQKFHGLKADGIVGAKTAHVLLRHRCGLPDFNFSSDSAPCRWPMPKITYYSKLRLPGITEDQADAAYDAAFAQWAAVCNVEPVRVSNHNLANIFAKSGSGRSVGLDDRGGTLAWSELPCNVSEHMQLDQMYDEAEDWSYDMAIAVICHELGHALGLAHLGKGNLMAPYYDPNVSTPQRGDVRAMVKLYGKPSKFSQDIKTSAELLVSGTITINGKPYKLVPHM
jgi:hypothetical protein